mmetsp:Transcript_102700/g.203911  ORF Transcript_102700/g.203911 Transcript_102700/m.203911 type:complete len:152 (+) Transcript_102700:50-505(+)
MAMALRRGWPCAHYQLATLMLLCGFGQGQELVDHPDTAEVRRLEFKIIRDTEVTIMLQLTDVPRWRQEQPLFLVPEDLPNITYVPLPFSMQTLTAGQPCDIKFKGLKRDTRYLVRLNWSLKAPGFPGGWSCRTLPQDVEGTMATPRSQHEF